MIQRLVAFIFLCSVAAGCSATGALADGMRKTTRHHHAHSHHRRYAVERFDVVYRECYTGWWQGLKLGHVRPRWGTYCRR